MPVKVVEAIGDRDGIPGDTTGNEILVRTFKTRSYPFTEFLRCKDRRMAQAAVSYGTRIAACSRFGYSQKQRWEGAKHIEYIGPDRLEQAEAGDFDCSSFVIECYRLAGAPLQMTGYTGSIRKLLLATGLFEDTTQDNPLAGDVWNAPGKHALMIASGGAEPDPAPAPLPAEDVVYVKGDNVRVRSGPSTDYPTIMIAHKGQTYPFIKADETTGWYWIETKLGTASITNKARYTEMRKQ